MYKYKLILVTKLESVIRLRLSYYSNPNVLSHITTFQRSTHNMCMCHILGLHVFQYASFGLSNILLVPMFSFGLDLAGARYAFKSLPIKAQTRISRTTSFTRTRHPPPEPTSPAPLSPEPRELRRPKIPLLLLHRRRASVAGRNGRHGSGTHSSYRRPIPPRSFPCGNSTASIERSSRSGRGGRFRNGDRYRSTTR